MEATMDPALASAVVTERVSDYETEALCHHDLLEMNMSIVLV